MVSIEQPIYSLRAFFSLNTATLSDPFIIITYILLRFAHKTKHNALLSITVNKPPLRGAVISTYIIRVENTFFLLPIGRNHTTIILSTWNEGSAPTSLLSIILLDFIVPSLRNFTVSFLMVIYFLG